MDLTRKRHVEGIPLVVLRTHIVVETLQIHYLNYCSFVTLNGCFIAFMCLNAIGLLRLRCFVYFTSNNVKFSNNLLL